MMMLFHCLLDLVDAVVEFYLLCCTYWLVCCNIVGSFDMLKFFLILSVMLYWLVKQSVCFDIITAVRFGLSDFKHSALVFSGVCYPEFWVIVSIRYDFEYHAGEVSSDPTSVAPSFQFVTC